MCREQLLLETYLTVDFRLVHPAALRRMVAFIALGVEFASILELN